MPDIAVRLLKYCPFCGATVHVDMQKLEEKVRIRCDGCSVSTKWFKSSLEYAALDEAVKAWNNRVKY